MGKVTAAAEKVKYKYHKEKAEHGRSETQGEHANEAAKASTKAEKERGRYDGRVAPFDE